MPKLLTTLLMTCSIFCLYKSINAEYKQAIEYELLVIICLLLLIIGFIVKFISG